MKEYNGVVIIAAKILAGKNEKKLLPYSIDSQYVPRPMLVKRLTDKLARKIVEKLYFFGDL